MKLKELYPLLENELNTDILLKNGCACCIKDVQPYMLNMYLEYQVESITVERCRLVVRIDKNKNVGWR